MDFTKAKKVKQEIDNNRVPMGYKRSGGYIIPSDWDVVPFCSLFNRLTRKNTESNQNVLTISAQQGLISQLDYYGTLYASEDTANYSLLHKGDFVYNRSYSSDYAYGAIKRLDAYDKGIVSPLYICFESKKSTNSDFYIQYFEAGMFNREIYRIAQEGARNHGMLNVSTKDFFNTLLVLPPAAEQRQISKVLSQHDQTIAIYRQLIAELRKKKEYFTQSIFPQQGEQNPRIRFPNHTSSWDQRRLGDVFEERSQKQHPELPVLTIIQGSGTVTRDESDRSIQYDKASLSNYKVVDPGDFVVHLRSFEGGLEKATSSGIVSPAYHILRGKDLDPQFYYSYFRSSGFIKKDLASHVYGIRDGRSIDIEGMKTIMIPYTVLDEQKTIGKFMGSLNSLIALHQQKLDAIQKMKKSLMQLLLTGIVRVNT